MQKLLKIIKISLGVACLLFALVGLISVILMSVQLEIPKDQEVPYFIQAYVIMSLLSTVAYCSLLYCGYKFIKLNSKVWPICLITIALEFIYYNAIGRFGWTHENHDVALSIGSASGIANVGFMFQYMSYFQYWGSLLCLLVGINSILDKRKSEIIQTR